MHQSNRVVLRRHVLVVHASGAIAPFCGPTDPNCHQDIFATIHAFFADCCLQVKLPHLQLLLLQEKLPHLQLLLLQDAATAAAPAVFLESAIVKDSAKHSWKTLA